MTPRTVPVTPTGLEGWTSCCGATVTFSGEALCCKACWEEVEPVVLNGLPGEALDTIIRRVIAGELTGEVGRAGQRMLLVAS